MSNTSTNRQDDLGRPARDFANYLYSAATSLDFAPHLRGAEQSNALGAYCAGGEFTVASSSSFSREAGTSDMRLTPSLPPDDERLYRMRRDAAMPRDMNLGPDGDYKKGLDNAAALSMVLRNDYPPDPTLRNFPRPKERRSPFPNMAAYGCLQAGHSSVDPQMSALPPYLPPTSAYASNPFSQYDMFNSLFQHPYHQLERPIRNASPYGVGRTLLASQSNSSQSPIGLGQSGSRLHRDYHIADAERSVYGKYATPYSANPLQLSKNAIEADAQLSSMPIPHLDHHSQGFDHHSQGLSNYPRNALNRPESDKIYPASSARACTSAVSRNGHNMVDPSVIDLTDSKLPDICPNSEALNVSVPNRDRNVPLPQNPMNSFKGNEVSYQQNASKEWSLGRKGHSAGLYGIPPPVQPVSMPSLSIPTTFESAVKVTAQPKVMEPRPMNPNATKWLQCAPSPSQQHEFSASSKMSGSSSSQVKSKTSASHITPSGLTFNYPESSGSKMQLPMMTHLGNGLSPRKSQIWSSKDGSKLSPSENHAIDSARYGKSCIDFGKCDNVPTVPPMYKLNHCDVPEHTNRNTLPRPSEIFAPQNSITDPSRHSVVQSAAKSLAEREVSTLPKENRTSPVDEAAPSKSDLKSDEVTVPPVCQSSKSTAAKEESCNQSEIRYKTMEENVVPLKLGSKRKLLTTKDGEQTHKKRNYTRRSDVWKKKGLQRQEKEKEKQPYLEKDKDAPVSKKQITACELPNKEDTESKNPEPELTPFEKISRPQRKSSGIDMDEEYLYGWFTEEETEKDDSSDEDYHCGTIFNKFRTRGVSKFSRQTRRLPRRRIDIDENSSSQEASKNRDYCRLSASDRVKQFRKRRRRDSQFDQEQESSLAQKELSEKREKTIGATADNSFHKIGIWSAGDAVEKALEQNQLTEADAVHKKKRKYRKRLDENGRPIKRAKRVKESVEYVPKKRRKRTKTCEQSSDRLVVENLDNINVPSFFRPALDEICSGDKHKTEGNCFLKETKIAQNHGTAAVDPSSIQAADSLQSDIASAIEDNKQPADNETKFQSARSVNPITDAGAASSGQAPIKIRKKPGRKPGWRKYLRADLSRDAKEVLKKKYKKPKGDGLCRFGMRKRAKRPKLRLNATASTLRTPAANDISATPVKTEAIDDEQMSLPKPKRKYNMSLRLEKKRLRLLNLGQSPTEKDSLIKPNPKLEAVVHEISKELQSQEYDYDFRSLSLCNDENYEDDVLLEPIVQDKTTEQPFLCTPVKSGLQTSSLIAPASSPFPSNFKKLCCNNAIGETLLHKAARMCYVENLQYYLESGTNVNQSDNAGYTALHEACVQNHLEAASLLLQYNIDVNKYAGDGTRPLHDAVEYDHLEMVRLLIACGADPMLSKFSGRSIPNMIRGDRMRKLLEGYLQELKETKNGELGENKLEWKFPCSAVFDISLPHQYKALDFAPDTEELSIEFEMYEEEPINIYLLQPDEEAERADYFLLDDYLKAVDHRGNKSSHSIRVVSMPAERFRAQIRGSKLQSLQYERRRPKPDLSGEYVELVVIDDETKRLVGAETMRMPVFDSCGAAKDDASPRPNRLEEKSSAGPSADKNLSSTKHHSIRHIRGTHPAKDPDANSTTNSIMDNIFGQVKYSADSKSAAIAMANRRKLNNRLKKIDLMKKVKEFTRCKSEKLPDNFDAISAASSSHQQLPMTSDVEIHSTICL